MKIPQFKIIFSVLIGLFFCGFIKGQSHLKSNQPYSSYWFIDELLQWESEKDPHAKFNISQVPLQKRFTDSTTQIYPELSTEPSIVSLIAPHTTSNHPSQGFQTVEEYAFPYWQYIDYLVQWGGSAGEGIVVTPTVFWIESAHLNGVEILGTVFFPPNVYGGKEAWVREFLQQDTNGNFPVADKLIEVANVYRFDGWFINQETNGMTKKEADAMQAFLKYFQKKSDGKLKIMWYDAMIEDGRVIWQDELNHHNSLYFQTENQKVSDIMFIDFGWSETQLEDSHKRAKNLNRSPWELYSGIDVQSKSYKTPTNWKGLYKNGKPYTTSIGLYWPNSTFDIAKDKQPESVYKEEEKFWNGTILEEEVPAWQSKEWKGFSNYIPARSVIKEIPFVTNFNYGLGKFYNEKGNRISNKSWHNLSVQDILPTWQWNVDTTAVLVNFDFDDSYTGGSSLKLKLKKNNAHTTVPLYKTSLVIKSKEQLTIAVKGSGKLDVVLITNDDKTYKFRTDLKSEWNQSNFSLGKLKGKKIVKIVLEYSGEQYETVNLGSLAITSKKEVKIKSPKVKIIPFIEVNRAELYVEITADPNAVSHTIYQITNSGKIWLGKTKSKNYYVAEVNRLNNEAKTTIEVVSEAKDGTKSKGAQRILNWD
jgi:endo-beta-N-acetylglucosaminidase D